MRVIRHGDVGKTIEKECGNCHALLEVEESDIQIDRSLHLDRPKVTPQSFDQIWERKVGFGPRGSNYCCTCIDCGARIPISFDEMPARVKAMNNVDFFAWLKDRES